MGFKVACGLGLTATNLGLRPKYNPLSRLDLATIGSDGPKKDT